MQISKKVFLFFLFLSSLTTFAFSAKIKNKIKSKKINENSMLVKKAREAMKNAYNPYSKFYVGAALLTKSGKIYTGCNIENVSFGATICAERVALVKAISEGDKNFVKIAIASSGDDFIYPCGICRQMLAEFNKNLQVIVSNKKNEIREHSLAELLPHSFDNFTPSK